MAKNMYEGMGKKGLDDLKQFMQRGLVELQNAVYTQSPYPVPQVVSAAQLSFEIDKSMDGPPRAPERDRGMSR